MPSNSEASFVRSTPVIRIDGREDVEMEGAVLSMVIHLPRVGMASAELTLSNWGSRGGIGPHFMFQQLRHGSRLELLLGESPAAPAFDGEITALEERYGFGATHLVVLAEDRLHRLARQRKSRVFENLSLEEVVRRVGDEARLSCDVSLPGGKLDWVQMNESDLAFLIRQLTPYDVCLHLRDGTLLARQEAPDPQPLEITPERRMRTVRIIADLNRLPRRLRVAGYNLLDDADASGASQGLSPSPAGETGDTILERLGWEGELMAAQPLARSGQEADALASHHFSRRASRFLEGEIVCQDAAELYAGREVQLTGFSPRLAGRYLVTECWHSFGERGLSTRLRVRRPDWSS